MTYLYWGIEYIISFIEVFMFFKFCEIFSHDRNNYLLKIIFSFAVALIVIVFNTISLVSPILSVIIIALYWLSQLYIQKDGPLKLFGVVTLYFSLLFSIDYIFTMLISVVSSKEISVLLGNVSMVRVPIILSSKTTLILVVNLIRKFTMKNKNQSRKAEIFFTFSAFVITIIATIMYVNIVSKKDYYGKNFLVLYFTLLLGMILSLFFIMDYIRKEESVKQEMVLIEQHNILLKKGLEEQEKIFLSWKKSIHDYKNKMIALEGLLRSEKYNDALNSVESELDLLKDKAFYISTGNLTIDILINNKLNYAKSQGVNFTFNIKISPKLEVSEMHLSTILGNLIDNAIEAVQNEKQKNVYVQMNNTEDNLIIKVMNSYSKKINISNTTKCDSVLHGIGLKSVKSCVDNYNGTFSIKQEDKIVIALVVI